MSWLFCADLGLFYTMLFPVVRMGTQHLMAVLNPSLLSTVWDSVKRHIFQHSMYELDMQQEKKRHGIYDIELLKTGKWTEISYPCHVNMVGFNVYMPICFILTQNPTCAELDKSTVLLFRSRRRWCCFVVVVVVVVLIWQVCFVSTQHLNCVELDKSTMSRSRLPFFIWQLSHSCQIWICLSLVGDKTSQNGEILTFDQEKVFCGRRRISLSDFSNWQHGLFNKFVCHMTAVNLVLSNLVLL